MASRAFSGWTTLLRTPWYSTYQRGKWFALGITDNRAAAALLAMDSRDRVLLISCWRAPLDRIMFEIPRGLADDGESSATCAMREFEEETGCKVSADKLRSLGILHPDSGILASEIALYHARLDEPFTDLAPQDGEVLALHAIPYPEVLAMIADGTITDAVTIAAVARLSTRGMVCSKHDRTELTARIEILDETGKFITEIETAHPERSLDEYSRNRPETGLSWRFKTT